MIGADGPVSSRDDDRVREDVGMRALVVGLARSGRAAVPALRVAGYDVVAYDRSAEADVDGLDASVHLGEWRREPARRRRTRREEPGCPRRRRARRGRTKRGHRDRVGDRARRPPPAEPDRRRHRHERQDDDDGAARRDLRGGRRGRPRSPGTSAARSRRSSASSEPGRVDRLRALVLPARGRRHAAAADRRPAEPRARPPRPARLASTRTATRSSASSRTRSRTTSRSCRAASARSRARAAGSSSPATTRSRRSRCIPGAHNRENAAAATAAARAAGVADEAIAEALRTFPGVAHRHRADRDDRRRPLRQRLEGDERRRCAACARIVPRRAAARHPRRPRQERELCAARPQHSSPAIARYLIGEAADEIAAALDAAGVRVRACGDLDTAVAVPPPPQRRTMSSCSRPRARRFDQFDDFEARGEDFRRLVENLSG